MILGDTKKPSFKVKKNDNYNTPVEAWEFLLNNMQQEATFTCAIITKLIVKSPIN